MNELHSGESLSIWLDTTTVPKFTPLSKDIKVDVCIVGGGLAGLTSAYLLSRQGQKVCVLEDFEIGSGQTGRTTAQFSTALDERYFVLEKYHGEMNTRLVAESHQEALHFVENTIEREKIDCEFEKVNGYLFSGKDESPDLLHHEMECTLRAGVLDVFLAKKAPFRSFETGPALCFRDQIQLHPLKYLAGLVRCVLENNGVIYTGTHVTSIEGGLPAKVKTESGHTVICKSVIVATNSPINDSVAIHTKQAPYRTYAIAVKIPKGSVEKGLYWDTGTPYHYIRTESDDSLTHDLLIVGGEDHKTGQNKHPEESYTRLLEWTKTRFPQVQNIAYQWSGQVMEPVDGLAYIGHNPMDKENVYVITGHSGNGMTYSTLAGILISDQILGKPNPWEAIYNPSRISLRAVPTFLRENGNTLSQYTDWLMEKQFGDIKHINPGEGVVFRRGIKMIAAYKDETSGVLTLHSAVCPHLGGIVRWNNAEKSWDCPCHGSRFDCTGKVIEGPACASLKPIEVKDDHFESFKTAPKTQIELMRTKNL